MTRRIARLVLGGLAVVGCRAESRVVEPRPGEVRMAPVAGPLVWVPGGTFDMGSPPLEAGRDPDEGPVHRVTVEGRWILRGEVSQALYERIVGGLPSHEHPPCGECPVYRVSWVDAARFANGLSVAEGLTPAYRYDGVTVEPVEGSAGYRLLTEAEWEHAARGGAPAGDPRSEVVPAAEAVGWVKSNSDSRLHPSCTRPPAAYGLCDMTGNVREWVWDRYGPYADHAVTDPRGPTDGTSFRVMRGGSWNSPPARARLAYRHREMEDYRSMSLGFRLARPGGEPPSGSNPSAGCGVGR